MVTTRSGKVGAARSQSEVQDSLTEILAEMRSIGKTVSSLASQMRQQAAEMERLRAVDVWRGELHGPHPSIFAVSESLIRCSCGVEISLHYPCNLQAYITHRDDACVDNPDVRRRQMVSLLFFSGDHLVADRRLK